MAASTHGVYTGPPGLYDARFEHDACGVAFVATLRGTPGRDIVDAGLTALLNLEHRGATVPHDPGTHHRPPRPAHLNPLRKARTTPKIQHPQPLRCMLKHPRPPDPPPRILHAIRRTRQQNRDGDRRLTDTTGGGMDQHLVRRGDPGQRW